MQKTHLGKPTPRSPHQYTSTLEEAIQIKNKANVSLRIFIRLFKCILLTYFHFRIYSNIEVSAWTASAIQENQTHQIFYLWNQSNCGSSNNEKLTGYSLPLLEDNSVDRDSNSNTKGSKDCKGHLDFLIFHPVQVVHVLCMQIKWSIVPMSSSHSFNSSWVKTFNPCTIGHLQTYTA